MTGTPRFRRTGRALVELLVVTGVVIAAAAMVSGVLNALVSMADARVKAGPNVVSAHHRLRTPGGPLDGGIVSAPAAAGYSFRLLRTTYAGPAVRLRRASDNAESDIGFAGPSDFDTTAAATFCAATSCFVKTWYDQSGNARHATQAGAAQQLPYTASCSGGKPCARSPTNQVLGGVSVTPSAGPTSFSAVARTDATSAICIWIKAGVQQFGANATNWLLFNGSPLAAPAALTAWHAGNGVINSAASVINIDGVETTGSIAPVTTAGIIIVASGDAANPCSYTEMIWWDGYALTAGERASLTANQRAYWGF